LQQPGQALDHGSTAGRHFQRIDITPPIQDAIRQPLLLDKNVLNPVLDRRAAYFLAAIQLASSMVWMR